MDHSSSTPQTWRVHPLRERPGVACLTLAVMGVFAVLVAGWMEHAVWGAFAIAVMMVGCNRFFFPTHYELTNDHITAKFPLQTKSYAWPELKRFVYDDRGGFLSTRVKPSLLDEYRGISVLFPLENGSELAAKIRSYLPPNTLVKGISSSTKSIRKEQTPCGG